MRVTFGVCEYGNEHTNEHGNSEHGNNEHGPPRVYHVWGASVCLPCVLCEGARFGAVFTAGLLLAAAGGRADGDPAAGAGSI